MWFLYLCTLHAHSITQHSFFLKLNTILYAVPIKYHIFSCITSTKYTGHLEPKCVCVCVCDLHTNYGVQVGSTALLNCDAKKGALWQYAFSFNFFYPVCSWRCKLYAEAAHTQENTVILQDQKVNDQQNLITSSVIYERTSRVHKLHRKSKFHMNECKITCHLLHLRPKKNCHSCRPQTYWLPYA